MNNDNALRFWYTDTIIVGGVNPILVSDRNTNCNNDDNRAVTIMNMAVVVNSECCSGCKVMMGRWQRW
jgi:hypothetical protein